MGDIWRFLGAPDKQSDIPKHVAFLAYLCMYIFGAPSFITSVFISKMIKKVNNIDILHEFQVADVLVQFPKWYYG